MKNQFLLVLTVLLFILLSLFSCKSFNNPTQYNNKPPKQIIPVNKAISLFKTNQKLKDTLLDKTLGNFYNNSKFQDTEFAWFSLDEMRHYINYIDAIQKENPNENVTGIRVYFGRYNNDSRKYENQQTVFLIPTVSNKEVNSRHKNLNHLPFVIEPTHPNNPIKGSFSIVEELVLETEDKGDRIKLFYKEKEASQQKVNTSRLTSNSATAINPENKTSTVLNEGELAPPPPKED